MKKFLIRIFLFGLIFFVIDKLFYVFLYTAPHLEVDKRLELLLEGKINKEVVVLGSSRGAYNIIAGQIEKETGLKAYNISYAGSTIEFHLFLLKTLLKYNNKPEIVILSIDNPYEFLYAKSYDFRYDRLYPLEKYNYINQELINQNDKSKLSWFLCLARLNKSTMSFRKKEVVPESPILACGSMPFLEGFSKKDLVFNGNQKPYPIAEELEEKKKQFREFQHICHINKIKLVYCFAPNFKTYDSALKKRIEAISLPEDKFFVYDTTNLKYKNKEYFHDDSHLNIKGAKIFTSELSKFINLNK
jgi:hypothetical protein